MSLRGASVTGTADARSNGSGEHALAARLPLRRDRTQALVGGLTQILDAATFGIAFIDPPEIFYLSTTCRNLLLDLTNTPKEARLGKAGEFTRVDQDPFPKGLFELIRARDPENSTHSTLINPARNLLVFVEIRPFRQGMEFGTIPNGFALLLRRADQAVIIDERLLQTTCELTVSEARICTLIANGISVGGISKQLRIHPSTTRTHLKRVYKKTRMTRQAELVRFLMNTARIG